MPPLVKLSMNRGGDSQRARSRGGQSPREHAPDVVVWFEPDHDAVVAIRISEPAPAMPVPQLLGPPEAKVPSSKPSDLLLTQWIYAKRGLTVHWDEDHLVEWLFGYRPMTVEQYMHSKLARRAALHN